MANELNTNDMTDEELKAAADALSKEEQGTLSGQDPDKTDDDKSLTSGADDKGEKLTVEDRLAKAEEQLKEAQKVNKGMYGSMKAERDSRQTLESKLDGITQVISKSFAKREDKIEIPDPEKLPVNRFKVEVDDDGTAYVPVDDALKSFIASQVSVPDTSQKVEELERTIEQDRAMREEEQAFQEQVESIVGEDVAYAPAFKEISEAYQWFNARVIDYQKENKLPGFVPTGDAIDIAVRNEWEQDFKKEFPTLEMRSAARLYDGQDDFRSALKGAAVTDGKKAPGKSAASNLKDIAGKASTLASVRNQKGTGGSLTLDEIAERSDEIPDMSDEDVAKLHRLMEREENAA